MDSVEQLALGSTDTLSNGHKADLEAAKRLAKRLYNLDGFKKADVARHLGKKYVWVFGRNVLFCKELTCTCSCCPCGVPGWQGTTGRTSKPTPHVWYICTRCSL